MDCFNLNIYDLGDKNYLLPCISICGLFMTYLGNRFIRPTIFSLGTILSMGSSYKLTHIIMEQYKYDNCLVKCSISVISGFSGGFLLLKLYKLSHFILGFFCGGSLGYLLYEAILSNYKLGIIYKYDTMFWGSIGIPGFLAGAIALHKEKELSIMTTSFIGPLILLWSFNQFTNYFNIYLFIPIYILTSSSGFYIQYNRYIDNQKNEDIKITYSGKM